VGARNTVVGGNPDLPTARGWGQWRNVACCTVYKYAHSHLPDGATFSAAITELLQPRILQRTHYRCIIVNVFR